MTYYNERTKQLKDKKITEALLRAALDYESGAIIEVRDTLYDIVEAIDAFVTQEEENEN